LLRPALVLIAVGVLGALASAAAAQSRRYPPRPVDKDAEKAAKSKLWNAAVTPERHPYQELVHDAVDALNQHSLDRTSEAIEKLDQAIKLLPREPDAYRLRGDAYFDRKNWRQCAADFAAADAHLQREDETPRAMAELHRKLGLCQARAGKLSDAERTLAETAASGNASGEIWMRLGEIRIAMGKLDEAIAALRSALEAPEPTAQALIHFLLAAAYDRARRPADALFEASEGVRIDHQQLGSLLNPVLPPLGAGELDYMLALAYGTEPAHPEYVLVYFRRFLKAAPDSPWRKRAEDHIRELKTSELPSITEGGGSALIDLKAVRAVVQRAMPELRACLTGFPGVLVNVEVTRVGPRTPRTERTRAPFLAPPEGVTVRVAIGELADRALDAADRCLEAQVARMALPVVKERDTHYKASFPVVGP
jgi:tetratricopeptide (TPR) repeat protein